MIVDILASVLIAVILYFLIERKYKGKERFLGYFLIALLVFMLSH